MTRRVGGMLFLLLLAPLLAAAESSVWRVSGAGGEMFLAGSIHVLRSSDYPLPGEFDAAYRRAGKLILETDLAALDPGATQRMMLERGTYPDGGTLKTHLPVGVYEKLARFCEARGLPLASMERFRPWVVVLTLTMAEMQALGFDADSGLDRHFHRRALRDGKPVAGLETPTEHLELMASLDQGTGAALILNFLEEMHDLERMLHRILDAWRRGDVTALETLVSTDMRREAPELHRILIHDRNRRWLTALEAQLQRDETALVVVGAAHLVGDDGLINLLRSRGYRVTQLSGDAG